MCALGNKPVILTFGLLHSRFLILGTMLTWFHLFSCCCEYLIVGY